MREMPLDKERSFDPACKGLARYFLPKDASEEAVNALAMHIQESIDDRLKLNELYVKD